jgi:trigger factor
VEITTEKLNEANLLVKGKIPDSEIEKRVDRLAKEAGKQMNIAGFRKGKVPATVVKKMHGEQLR